MKKNRHHRIDYVEFQVKDLAEALEFYGGVFDWEFTQYGPRYAGIKGDDGEVGGICEGEPLAGGSLVVIYSDDLEETVVQIKKQGGSICKEIFSFPGGRRFHFCDPSGNELAVWNQDT